MAAHPNEHTRPRFLNKHGLNLGPGMPSHSQGIDRPCRVHVRARVAQPCMCSWVMDKLVVWRFFAIFYKRSLTMTKLVFGDFLQFFFFFILIRYRFYKYPLLLFVFFTQFYLTPFNFKALKNSQFSRMLTLSQGT